MVFLNTILAMEGKGEIENSQVFSEILVIREWKRFLKENKKETVEREKLKIAKSVNGQLNLLY